ncbi:outer membrane beta-barrel protein [Parathalassolituus penaei]|uniref:Outer membrane beta-barrel protein n=1 Tax=Parathalassolituus penaei TaxID=2997323 RepID=A0A9X3ITC8_9GAMM|nr:outer membrane beta-barrel protein [Parathalassolituus penaei]MCY0965769.1 outer membrane beta-barrel protein [Parathalassolituus penaei]
MAAHLTPVRAGLATALLVLTPFVNAEVVEDKPSVGAMVADVVLARPLYFVMSQAGAVLYTVTLPFSAMGGNSEEAAEAMVITPLQATYTRCLGCGKSPNTVGELKEGEGKEIDSFVLLSGGRVAMSADGDDSSDLGLGIYYGSHFALADKSRFDVMAGYKDFGSVKFDTTLGTASEDLSSWQVITRVGRALDAKSDVMFKLGLHRWTLREELAGTSETATGYGLLYGIGLDHEIDQNWRAGVDFTYYNIEDSGLDIKATVTTLDATIGYYF